MGAKAMFWGWTQSVNGPEMGKGVTVKRGCCMSSSMNVTPFSLRKSM